MSQSMWSSQPSHDYRRQSSSSAASLKRGVPYTMNTNQPPTPSSMFESPAGVLPFGSPSGYSQPPTPSSMLDPHMSHPSSISSQGQGAAVATNPMARYIDNQEGPYSALHLAAASIPDGYDRTSYPTGSTAFMAMQQPSVKSDSASIVTPLHPTAADSGYFTHPSKTYSTGSAEPVTMDQTLPPDVMNFDQIHFQRKPSNRSRSHRNAPTSLPSSAAHQSHSPEGELEELVCKYCKYRPRLKSELKKHLLRHERPFKCEDKSCPRSKDGFTTPNDLDRHKRSKHNIFPKSAKVYVCASAACSEANKSWPRYDNFKQHVERMHKMEDMEALIEESERDAKDVKQTGLSIVASEDDYDESASHDLNGALSSRDGTVIVNAQQAPYDDTQMFANSALEAPRNVHAQYEDYSDPDSLNNDFDHHGYTYPASVGHPSYTEFPANQFDNGDLDSGLSPSQDPHLGFGYDNVLRGLTGGKGPPIVVHNAQEQKQRQDHDLAHMLDGTSRAAGEHLDESFFGAAFKEANLTDDWKLDSTLPLNGAHLASRVRQPLATRPGKSTAKVYKANSVAGTRAQVMTVNSNRTGQGRMQRSPGVPGAQCRQCKKILPRQCDLKKHERRHTRPFGCTFDMCNKQFGSKNDWKRHESSQHFQEEQWRCKMPIEGAEGGLQCAKLYDEWSAFLAHLEDAHGADEAQVETMQKTARIGRNHQRSYFCGFCADIIELTQVGRKAWDERFDHIGDHFLHEGKNIRDWVSPQGHRTKGQMRNLAQTGAWSNQEIVKDEGEPAGSHAMEGVEGEVDGEAEADVEAEVDMPEQEPRRATRREMPADPVHCCMCNDGPYSKEFRHCACVKCQHSCEHCFDRTTRTELA